MPRHIPGAAHRRSENRSYNPKYYREHRDSLLEHMKKFRKGVYEAARQKIAERWGDIQPRCRFDTLPDNHPLRSVPCYGKIQIDHMNGGGHRELDTGRSKSGSREFY